MSGGSLNYFYCNLQEHIGDFGDKELDDLVADLAELFHEREWYLSSDSGKGDWVEARDAFKNKWFTKIGRQKRIEKYLKEFENEIRETFGMKKDYCKTCKYWSKRDGPSDYGDCECEKRCLMHRSESCERYEKRGEAE